MEERDKCEKARDGCHRRITLRTEVVSTKFSIVL